METRRSPFYFDILIFLGLYQWFLLKVLNAKNKTNRPMEQLKNACQVLKIRAVPLLSQMRGPLVLFLNSTL